MQNKFIKQSGVTLIELMVALTIGAFLTLASAYILQFAKQNYVTNDSIARLQEQGRYALNILENDIRLANYWGNHNKQAGVTNSEAFTSVTGDCNNNWSNNLSRPIYGTNNDTNSPSWAGATCITDANILDETDTLVIYHANPNEETDTPNSLEAGNIYIRSNELPRSELFVGTTPPNLGNRSKSYKLSSSGYYIRPFSFDASDNIPMLRRITLVDGGSDPAVQDFEIAPGVEDMQIQFGISAPAVSAAAESTAFSIDRYVEPDDEIFNNAIPPRILSVRLWLLMRSEGQEQDFLDTSTYEYASKTFKPGDDLTGEAAKYRRLLIAKTIQLRNQVR